MCLLASARAAAGQTALNGAVDHQDSRRCVMHVDSDTLARWRVDSADMSTARSLHRTCSMCPPVAAQAAAVCRACTAAADRDRRSNLRKTTRLGSGHHHRRHLLKRPTSQAPERTRPHSLRPPRMTAPSRPASSHPTMVVKACQSQGSGSLAASRQASFIRASPCAGISLRARLSIPSSPSTCCHLLWRRLWASIIAYTSHDHLDARYGADRTHIVGRAHHGRHRAGADGLGRGSSLISEAR